EKGRLAFGASAPRLYPEPNHLKSAPGKPGTLGPPAPRTTNHEASGLSPLGRRLDRDDVGTHQWNGTDARRQWTGAGGLQAGCCPDSRGEPEASRRGLKESNACTTCCE